MLPQKGKCVIGNTSLLLTIVACFSIAAADMKLGNIKTSTSFFNEVRSCRLWSRIMDIQSCYTSQTPQSIQKMYSLNHNLMSEVEESDYDNDKWSELKLLRKHRDIYMMNRNLTATNIRWFRILPPYWKLNRRDSDEHDDTLLANLTYKVIIKRNNEKHLWDQGNEHLSNVAAQYLSEPLLNIKHQKQLEVLTIPKHGDNDLFTYLVFNFLYDHHLIINWNLIEWLRKRSNDQHLSGSVEHLNDHLIMVYDEELFGFQNKTDKQMMEAYSEILKSFTKSEPDSHNLNGGDGILPDHLGSIMGIEATVLLTLLLLSNLSIRIVNKKDCSKASSSHSKILKVAAKERRQNFPTENQAKGVRLCEMCVNQNSTVAHCKTCKLYICAACSILHERVWALMNHTLCPFKEI